MPKSRAVDDEDPGYSPMEEESRPMTVRGEDGRVHKAEELAGTQSPPRRDEAENRRPPLPRPSNPD